MKEVKPNSPAAIKFLQGMFPKGPWLLVAIDPEDRARLDAATFGPTTLKEAQAYLDRHNGSRNIYFHVNPVMSAMTKKARREDIKEVIQLHVDIDPRPGQDVDEEQKRALALLTTERPKGVPEPTLIVFSGGGYQAFWKLKAPIPINGDIAAAEDAKRYNQQLETLFKADHCHNIDRLMRLPGTVNLPDLKKRQKGRVPALAMVVAENPKAVYPLSAFTPAKDVAPAAGFEGVGTGQTVQVDTGNIERISIEELKDRYDISDKVLEIIVQGESPREEVVKKKLEESKDVSRSAWLFEVCCALARAEVPDQIIYAVITDPTYGISDAVRITKSGKKLSASAVHNYAVRQIERAKEYAVDPLLMKMNERHAVIGNAGGKCQVIEEQYDEGLGRTALTFQSFGDIKNRYNNKRVQVGTDKAGEPIYMPMGDWWLKQEKRRQYERIVFDPSGTAGPEAYNLWRGFAYESRPGDGHQRYLKHVLDNICSGNVEYYNWLIGWMARAIQYPAEVGGVAVVLRGDRGTGKSQFALHFGRLFGRHFIHTSESKHLTGHFNQHLRDCLCMFADEAFFAGDKKHESVLKTLVTEPTMMFEKKGHDAVPGPNYMRMIMASNSDWVVPAGPHERRFFILDVGADQRQNAPYFRAIAEDMNNGGYENLMHFLSSYDLSGWNVYAFPRTDALRQQQTLSLSVEEQWWLSKLEAGAIMDADEAWPHSSYTKAVYFDYNRWASASRGPGAKVMTENSFGRWLTHFVKGIEKEQRYKQPVTITGLRGEPVQIGSPSIYVWPSLSGLRAAWEGRYGPRDWTIKQSSEPRDPPNELPF